jgi:2-keto-4-pentenoate hydratase/2-oxohepta-3-ene-1,7-dioic acid hydratase in catechol pathway
MKIAAFSAGGDRRLGVVAEEEGIWPLDADLDVLGLLAATPEERARAEARARRSGAPLAFGDVTLLAPLKPPTIRDFVTFEAHVEGLTAGNIKPEWYEAPFFYFSNANAVVATGEDVPVPPGCVDLDFELEVAAVIGKPGRDLAVQDAGGHIAAFTIFNDWSARDIGRREARLGLGLSKCKDGASTVGPWLVTADELAPYRTGDRYDLELIASVNGVPLGRDTLASMSWSFDEMVAYAARGAWVCAGDLLASGTCRWGCLAELWGRRGRQDPPPLKPGDEVTLQVQGIGSVTNRVVEGAKPQPVPAARAGSLAGSRADSEAGSRAGAAEASR